MPLPKDLTTTIPPSVLVYGRSGTGKTAWAMTAGRHAQMIDADYGFRTALSLHDKYEKDRQAVDVHPFMEKILPEGLGSTPPSLWPTVKSEVLKLSAAIWKDPKVYPFKVLIIDSLTALSEHCLRYIRHFNGKTSSGKDQDGRMIYGLAMQEILNLVLVIRSLPVAKILIAHSALQTNADQSTYEELAIYGKDMPNKLCAAFDEVYYFRTAGRAGGGSSYLIQTCGTGALTAKTRTGIKDLSDQNTLSVPELFRQMGFPLDNPR